MRAKSLLLLFLALGCGLVASIGITQVISTKSDPAVSSEVATIFVALKDLPMGDLISPESLKLEEWPKDKVPPGALTKIEDVEGRRPKSKVVAGMPLIDGQLLGKGVSSEGAAPQIPPGYRVVSVKVNDESGISNMIRPRDRVDVLLYVKETPGVIAETSTQTILQDLQVFAVNDVFRIEETEGENSIAAKTVSLLVTPSQAEVVTLATQLGQIRLALRSHEDKEHVNSPGTFAHELDQAERSNRDAETAPAPAPANNSFLDMVKSRTAPAKKPVVWKMQLIQGAQLSEVEMQMASSASARGETDDESSGFDRWTTTSIEGTTPPQLGAPANDPEEGKQDGSK